MCIICVKPAGVDIQENIINTMWYNNDDGAGFMYVDDNKKLQVVKGLMTLKDFKEAYDPHRFRKLVMHFRIKTHGETNEENTHPFRIDENLAFSHNGVIRAFGSYTHSDTWHFNEELIKPLRQEFNSFLNSQPITKLISEHIGYSKLVFMDDQENITIVNKHLGDESSDGFWFSNASWKSGRGVTTYTPPQQQNFQKKETSTPSSSNDSTGNSSTTKETTSNSTKTSTSSSNTTYELNDLVYLNTAYTSREAGDVGVIAWFTGGRAAAVSFADGTEYIPYVFIDRVLPIKMIRRVGHLNDKSVLFFVDESTNGQQTRVYDVTQKKYYWIPVDSWIVLTKDEYNSIDFVDPVAFDEAAQYSIQGI